MSAPSGGSLIPDKSRIVAQAFTEAILDNLSSVQRWTSWKEDHENLKKTLTTLPNKLSHQAVVPFGSKALVRAKIVHTNEILACIGDGWFVKQSAHQAVEFCERRIKESERMLERLKKEHDLINNMQTLPTLEEAFPREDQNEIVEEYDEEKEAEWRVRHREMERKYRQELAELRRRRKEETPPQTEEELFRRLDLLELEEELNDELERLNELSDVEEDEEDEDEDEGDGDVNASEEEVEKKDSQEKHLRTSSSINLKPDFSSHLVQPSSDKTHETDLADVTSKGFQKVQRNTSALEPGKVMFGFTDAEGNEWRKSGSGDVEVEKKSVSLKKSGKSVSFASDASEGEDENEELHPDIFIRFKHSDNEFQNPSREEIGSGDSISIISPRDIYTQYKQLMTPPVPKSVLKKVSSYETDSATHRDILPSSKPFGSSIGLKWEDENNQNEKSTTPARDLSHLPPVLQDVVVTSTKSNPSEQPAPEPRVVVPNRPVSKFKASRAASRK